MMKNDLTITCQSVNAKKCKYKIHHSAVVRSEMYKSKDIIIVIILKNHAHFNYNNKLDI